MYQDYTFLAFSLPQLQYATPCREKGTLTSLETRGELVYMRLQRLLLHILLALRSTHHIDGTDEWMALKRKHRMLQYGEPLYCHKLLGDSILHPATYTAS